MLEQSDYLKSRIDDQIAWYDKKSGYNKRIYKRLRTLSIVIAGSIPVLAVIFTDSHAHEYKVLSALLAALIAVIESLLSLNKYRDLWTSYRATSEGLKYQRYLFEAGAEPFDKEGAFKLYVKASEDLMTQERTSWVKTATTSEEPAKKDGEGAAKPSHEAAAHGAAAKSPVSESPKNP